jgi:hypothetical protein
MRCLQQRLGGRTQAGRQGPAGPIPLKVRGGNIGCGVEEDKFRTSSCSRQLDTDISSRLYFPGSVRKEHKDYRSQGNHLLCMDQLAEQISSACQVALDPSPNVAQEQRHGAYAFLQQVKDASQETWQACWKLFLEQRDGGGGASNEARMFALQVVTEA